MASCPFQKTASSVSTSNGALKKSFSSRQSSMQLVATDEVDEEDRNTLNLKTLNAALLILTAPPVSFVLKRENVT